MEYKFAGKISLSDYTAFNSYTLRNSLMLPGRLSYWTVMFIVTCLVILNLCFGIDKMSAFDGGGRGDTGLPMIISTIINIFKSFPIVIIVILTFIAFRVFVGAISKKMYNSTEFYSEEHHYTVDEKNIKVFSKSLGDELIIGDISKIAFNRGSVYVYITQSVAYIIKDSFFKNLNEYDRFKMFIKEHYESRKA